MKNDDGDFLGTIIGFLVIIVIIGIVLYILVLLASLLLGVAAAGGTVFGGISAIKNYISSFKENVIDSNRTASKTV